MTEPTPAGWYPDPDNPAQQRYWDGSAWTDDYAPTATPDAQQSTVSKKPIYKRAWFIALAAVVVLAVIGNLAGGDPSTTSESSPAATEDTAPSTEDKAVPVSADPEPEAEPEPEPEPVEEPEQPDMTMGQQQAVLSAEGYLRMGGFSREGLIDQLMFEDFSTTDAEFAVDYLSPDWKAQAVESADGYLSMGGFSRKGLIEQLEFEDFTSEEAEHAVNTLDPDWNQQAAESAKGYVDMGGFSRNSLIDQLLFEGFTQSEAEYGAQAVGY